MKTLWKAAAFLIVAFVTGSVIQACSSDSTAQQSGGITEEQLNTAITAALSDFKRDEVDPIAEKTRHIVTFTAGAPNPVQIAPLYPVYFDSPDCSGQAYIHSSGVSYRISKAAERQGVAFRYTMPGQADEAPETYAWMDRNLEFEIVSPFSSALTGPGTCDNSGGPSVIGFPVQQQSDPDAYETLTGVPAGGFLEGTQLSSFSAVKGDGLVGADFYDMPTSTGFIVRFDAGAEPVVYGGSE